MAEDVRIALPGPVTGTGGPTSFRGRMTREWSRQGYDVRSRLDDGPFSAILVVAGTRHVGSLLANRRRGARVVHRLDGLLWRHRALKGRPLQRVKHELRNRWMCLIRDRLADHVVYQSRFVRDWWHDWFGAPRVASSIIYNGVDLDEYRPDPGGAGQGDGILLCVEGNVQVDPPTLATLLETHRTLLRKGKIQETRVLGGWEGGVPEDVRREPNLRILGPRPRDEVQRELRRASLFLNLEIQPPCPNAVIEALASGVPVVGFDTGALAELVGPAGRVVPYGGDPWRMDPPGGLTELAAVALDVLANRSAFARAARERAERLFDVTSVAQRYLDLLVPGRS